jgi:ABC-type dipeptide/oligopeptide/nickel transport system permease component
MTSLYAYIIRRLILLVAVIVGVTVLIFALSMLFSPDVRALLYIRNIQQVSTANIGKVIQQYGLNDPFYLQYGRWMSQVLQGNLGWSQSTSQSVVEAIRTRLPYTFEIVLFAAPIIVFLGIYLGVQSAIHRNGIIDHSARVVSIVGWSLPSFWLGMLLLAVFYGMLGWFPPGSLSQQAQNFIHSPTSGFVRYTGVDIFDGLLNGPGSFWVTVDALRHVVLPVFVIVTIDIALLIRVMRSSMLEALNKAYVVTARAKGLSKKVVIYKHARRNALIPVATLSGMLVAGLLGGLVITETVFGFGGLGQFSANAAIRVDMPAVLGYAMLTAFMFVIANLTVDILYAYIDPRIRLE